MGDEPDRLSRVQRERIELLGPEPAGEQCVVAQLGVGVERQVIGRERDVGVEQELQAALEHRVDRAGARPPEQAVVDEQEVGAAAGGKLEQLEVRRDARARLATSLGPGTCRPLGQ